MHEDSKIAEAEHFLGKLNSADHEHVRFELSAFLTAARSALQYALEEAQTKAGGKAWYDREVKADSVVAFLKQKRENIHERPVPMATDASVMLASSTLTLSGTVSMVVIDGKTGQRREIHSPPSTESMQPVSPSEERRVPKTTVAFRYAFRDWSGGEDVPTLCARYLAEIKRIVADGRSRGLLTR
jgi:hypothetical protein